MKERLRELDWPTFRRIVWRLNELDAIDRLMRSNRGLRNDPAAQVAHMGGHRHGLAWFGRVLPARTVEDVDLEYELGDSLLRLWGTGGKATRFHRRKINYIGAPKAPATDITDESSWGVRKRSVDGVLVDFLSSGGWHIEKVASTGGKAGKPIRGAIDPAIIVARLGYEAARTRDGAEALRGAVERGRGRPRAHEYPLREALAKVVARTLARPQPLNARALAQVLRCNPSTVYAQRIDGEKLIEFESPKGLHGLPFAFGAGGVLKCPRGHRTYSPTASVWVDAACGHDRCTERLQLLRVPKSNVIALKGERHMNVTEDERLALDAERLGEVLPELFEIAARFQARYPTTKVFQQTVDRILDAALNSGTVSRAA